MRAPNLNNFGKKLKLNKRTSKKEKFITEKELFIETMDMFQGIWDRSNATYEAFQINLLEYEEKYYQVIENLFLMKYGLWKTEIILWYIFARLDAEGNVAPLLIQSENKEDEEVILTNAEELWNLLERLGKDPDINNLDK